MRQYVLEGSGTVRVDDITPDASAVVGFAGSYYFRFSNDDGKTTVPVAIDSCNADASYIVGSISQGAALWCQDLPITIVQVPDRSFEFFRDVSADGSKCTLPASKQLLIWDENLGTVELPGLYQNASGTGNDALALSADGDVVVGRARELTGGSSAFIWTAETGTRRIKDVLNSLGVSVGNFYLNEATDISSDGTTICGNGGSSPTHTNEGWMCRIPRTALSPYSARPNYVKPIFGTITGGDRRGTFKPDDDREEFTSGVTPTFSSAPITVEFSATQARTFGKLDFEVELQVNKVGLQQSLDLWDWDLNNWVQVDTRTAKKDLDQLVTLTFPTEHFYVRYDGRVKARLRIKPNTPQSQPGFKAKVDYVAWKVTPP